MSTTLTLRSKNRHLAGAAMEMLEAEHPMTLRQLLYRLVSSGELANSQAEYSRLGGLMTRLREAGDVQRNWIVDHVRASLKPSSWSGLADFADTVRECYRKDFWASQTHHVEVFVEKDAVAGTIQPVTAKRDVALHVCRGYASVSFAGEIADQWAEITKPIYAYFLGDFDPSGFDLERDLREKLARYSGRYYLPGSVIKAGALASKENFIWKRLGVRAEDFHELDLIKLPVKHSDNRAAKFIQLHGNACAEIDAIPPTELRRRVSEAIDSHVDAEAWERLQVVEQAERETLETFVSGLEREN